MPVRHVPGSRARRAWSAAGAVLMVLTLGGCPWGEKPDIGATPPDQFLLDWLDAHPQVKDAMVWFERDRGWQSFDDWSPALKAQLTDAFAQAWRDEDQYAFDYAYPMPTLADTPEALASTSAPSGLTSFSVRDATRMYISALTFSLFFELNQADPPWSITEYDSQELALLFDGRTSYFEPPICVDTFSFSLAEPPFRHCRDLGLTLDPELTRSVPAPAWYTWGWLVYHGIYQEGQTRRETIGNLLEWARRLHHAAGSSSEAREYYWGTRGMPPFSQVAAGTDPEGFHPDSDVDARRGHWVEGCHGVTGFLREALRVVNIPVRYRTIFEGTAHRTPYFPTEGLYLSHGDDVYGTGLMDATPPAPGVALLVNEWTFQWWFGDSVPFAQKRANIGRQRKVVAIQWIPDVLMEKHCQDLADGTARTTGGRVYRALQPQWSLYVLDYLSLWGRMETKMRADPRYAGCF